jgi:hypothetical protein
VTAVGRRAGTAPIGFKTAPRRAESAAVSAPSTKGLMLQQVVTLIQDHLDAGRLTRDELETRLEKEDLAFFEGDKIVPSLWYPVSQNHRLLDLYFSISGRRHEAMVELGRVSARQVLQLPAYAALFQAAAGRDAASAGPLLVKLAELVLNFTKWTFHGTSLDEFDIEVTEAAEYSDHACHTAIGFMEVLGAELFGKQLRVTCERPTPDHIVFRQSRR